MASILEAARCRASAVVLLLLAYVGLAGCSTSHLPNAADGAPAALAQFYNQKLNWFNCKQPLQCARLTVPVNYADPTGRTITLAVVRALATDPAHRIGSLLTNPGGPGVSGVGFFEHTYPARPAGFQLEVNRFLADCVTHPDCPLGTNPAAAATALSGFFAAAQQHPVATGSPRTVDGALAQTGVFSGLYDSPTSWPFLRTALAGATTGDGRALLALADQYNERYPDGHYTNSGAANVAINCLDRPDAVHSTADVQAELPAYQQASPTFGITFVWEELLCADWPVPPQTQPHQIHYTGQPPILVIGNTDDPATPYPGAQDMAGQLGSAVLLTYRSDGHTAYGRGSTCINNAVDQYLTAATPPPARTTCQRDPAPPH